MNSILDGLDLLGESQLASDGKPLQLPLLLIDEDPEQPRREFDETALAELADTIRERGVRSPISVRPHPQMPERWILNFGSRRLRASKLAERSEIPAFVDACADSYDQVIENEQREPLTPLELALFIQRRQALGESQRLIGRRLGKSQTYVMYASALIDAPGWLIALYREGRCRGVKELHELRRLHRDDPKGVEQWICGPGPVPLTRRGIDELRHMLGKPSAQSGESDTHLIVAEPGAVPSAGQHASAADSGGRLEAPRPERPPTIGAEVQNAASKPAAPKLQAEADGVLVTIDSRCVPAEPGFVYVTPIGGGEVQAVPASTLKLLGFDKVA